MLSKATLSISCIKTMGRMKIRRKRISNRRMKLKKRKVISLTQINYLYIIKHAVSCLFCPLIFIFLSILEPVTVRVRDLRGIDFKVSVKVGSTTVASFKDVIAGEGFNANIMELTTNDGLVLEDDRLLSHYGTWKLFLLFSDLCIS